MFLLLKMLHLHQNRIISNQIFSQHSGYCVKYRCSVCVDTQPQLPLTSVRHWVSRSGAFSWACMIQSSAFVLHMTVFTHTVEATCETVRMTSFVFCSCELCETVCHCLRVGVQYGPVYIGGALTVVQWKPWAIIQDACGAGERFSTLVVEVTPCATHTHTSWYTYTLASLTRSASALLISCWGVTKETGLLHWRCTHAYHTHA